MSDFEINELIAEETGIHTGDGSMNIYNGVHCYTLAGHLIDDEKYFKQIIKPLYKKAYNKEVKLRNWSQGTIGFRICDKKIVEFKNKILGLPLGKKHCIKIPKQILDNKKFENAFLRGFVSTDGSLNTFLANKKTVYPRIEMSNISIELMKQINRILIRKGFRTSFWIVKKKFANWNKVARLNLHSYKMVKKWDEEIGFNNPKQTEKIKKLKLKRQDF